MNSDIVSSTVFGLDEGDLSNLTQPVVIIIQHQVGTTDLRYFKVVLCMIPFTTLPQYLFYICVIISGKFREQYTGMLFPKHYFQVRVSSCT